MKLADADDNNDSAGICVNIVLRSSVVCSNCMHVVAVDFGVVSSPNGIK